MKLLHVSVVRNETLLAVERRCLFCFLAFNMQARNVIMCIMCWQACYSQAAEERSAGRVPAETKECRRCHETKGKADFYHSKMTADGLQSYCKVCSLCWPYGALPSSQQSSEGPEAAWACLACTFTRACLSMKVHDGYISAFQQCYSVASAQRRSRTAEGTLTQSSAEDGQQGVSLHLEDGVPVYQDMSINMQVRPPTAPLLFHLSACGVHVHLPVA